MLAQRGFKVELVFIKSSLSQEQPVPEYTVAIISIGAIFTVISNIMLTKIGFHKTKRN